MMEASCYIWCTSVSFGFVFRVWLYSHVNFVSKIQGILLTITKNSKFNFEITLELFKKQLKFLNAILLSTGLH